MSQIVQPDATDLAHPEDVMEAALTTAGFVDVRKEAAPEFGRGLWVAETVVRTY